MRSRSLWIKALSIATLFIAIVTGFAAGQKAEYSQGVTDTSIKIGVFGPFSGNAAVYSKAQHMTLAILKNVSEKGGINGRKLEMIEADDACDATTLQGIIRKFFFQDKVFFIYGGSCSNAIVAAKDLIERNGQPVLTANAASGLITDPPLKNLFQPKPTTAEQGLAVAKFIKSNPNAKRIAVVGQSDEIGQSHIKATLTGLQRVGLDVVANEQIAPDAGDATPQVRKVLAANADMLVVAAYPQPMSVFLRDAAKQGLTIPIVTSDVARPDEQFERLRQRDPVKNMFSATNLVKPVADPSFTKYRDLLAKYYPNDKFDAVALEGAIYGDLITELLKRMGDSLTWDNWIKTIESPQGFETAVGGPMRFLPFEKGNPSTRRAAKDMAFQVLDPTKTDAAIATVKDWSDWLKIRR